MSLESLPNEKQVKLAKTVCLLLKRLNWREISGVSHGSTLLGEVISREQNQK